MNISNFIPIKIFEESDNVCRKMYVISDMWILVLKNNIMFNVNKCSDKDNKIINCASLIFTNANADVLHQV